MKKNAILATIAVCSLLGAFLFGTWAADDGPRSPFDSPATGGAIVFGKEAEDARELTKEEAETVQLRSRLLELTKQRLPSMTNEELLGEIERLSKEQRETEAAASLRKAEALLEDVVEKYPESKAANDAKKMLQILHAEPEAKPIPQPDPIVPPSLPVPSGEIRAPF